MATTRAPGHPVRAGEHPDLLDVGDLADVDLLGELPAHRGLDVLVGAEPAAGQRPPAGVGCAGALPREHLQRTRRRICSTAASTSCPVRTASAT